MKTYVIVGKPKYYNKPMKFVEEAVIWKSYDTFQGNNYWWFSTNGHPLIFFSYNTARAVMKKIEMNTLDKRTLRIRRMNLCPINKQEGSSK